MAEKPAASAAAEDSKENPAPEAILKMSAEQREQVMARSRGVGDEELATLQANTAWYVSNRADDRVVIWERDPRHPNGEILIGGSAPSRAYRTRDVDSAVYSLQLIEVPEPLRTVKDADGNEVANRKYPAEPGADPAIVVAAQPGQPIPLGRKLDPELWDEKARADVAAKQAKMPSDIPVSPQTVVGGAR
jgi:hypothetical protein